MPITCVSLKPTDFGDRRIVLKGRERSYPTMIIQIVMALENAQEDLYSFVKMMFFTINHILILHLSKTMYFITTTMSGDGSYGILN